MLFGLCNEMFEGWTHAEAFNAIKSAGYDGVELAPFTLASAPDHIDSTSVDKVRAAAEDAGLPIIGLHWLLAHTQGYHLTSPEADVRRRTTDLLKRHVQTCAALGGKVLVFGSPQQRSLLPGVSRQQAWDYAVEALKEVGQESQQCGVTFCIEPLSPQETDFINTADEAWALVQDIGSPGVTLMLDVKAMSSESQPMLEIIRRYASRAGHFHANDPNLRGPGFGDLDFTFVFQELVAHKYSGYVSVEVFDFSPDPLTIARKSVDYMKKCLSEGSAAHA